MTKIKKLLLLYAAVLVTLVVAAVWYLSDIYTDCRMSEETFENSLNQPAGDYVDADMLYADEEKSIFYYNNGIFVYNYNDDKIEQMIDLEKLNCAVNEQKPNMGTIIHSDGEKISLINYGDEKEKFNNYLIYIKTGIAKKEVKPKLGKDGGIGWASWIAELDCWRSEMFVYVGNEMFYMELDDGADITELKLVAAGQDGISRREFYPFDKK